MLGFSQVDIWFYGGIAIMILAVLAGIGDIVVFGITGKKLRNKLEKEYGKPQSKIGRAHV